MKKAVEVCLKRGMPIFTKECGDCLHPTGKSLVAGTSVWIGDEDIALYEGAVVEIYSLAELSGYYVIFDHLFPEPNLVRIGSEFKEATVH